MKIHLNSFIIGMLFGLSIGFMAYMGHLIFQDKKQNMNKENAVEMKPKAVKQSYSLEEAKTIWKAGQEYWKTSGASITFEELTANMSNSITER